MVARLRRRLERASGADGGFTLVETLTVTIIIGILAAIAITTFVGQRGKAGDATTTSDVRNLATMEESYLAASSTTYGSASQLATQQRLPASVGESDWLYTNGAAGYCIVGHHALSQQYLVYDSQRGGLQSTGYSTLSAAQAACTSRGYTAAGTITNTNGTIQTN